MNPTHLGSLPGGKRVHLTDTHGWSACSRRTVDVFPIDRCSVDVETWCGSCLNRLAGEAAREILRSDRDAGPAVVA
jgi:hypothetical protein